jgi:hypothetical protein
MAPHAIALRALGIATIVYAGVLLAEPAVALRAVFALGPVYESIVTADPEAQKQLTAAGITPAQAASQARWHMLGGAWPVVAPALVLGVVGLLGGVLLALGCRAGPWVVLVFAIWPAVAWALQRLRGADRIGHDTYAVVKTIRLGLFGKVVHLDARTYGTVVQVAFLLVTLGILGWAFAAGRRGADRGPGSEGDAAA